MRSKFKWIFTLLIAFTMQFSFAQEKTVTGVVSDAGGPLPGANVVVKGTTRGVQTDVDGKYAIKTKVGETLVYSFVGMEDQSKTVGASNSINVKLASAAKVLDEVLVTGAMGIKRRPDQVVSTQQQVKNKELTQAANPSVIQSLAGKVSGLQINKISNGVNPSSTIVLRGNRSITGDNQALIVIDGAISSAGALALLSPDIVESTNVIKGLQGAALYGEQGRNGAIIVTTKRGNKENKLNVSLTSSVDFETVAFLPQRQERYGQGWNGNHVTYENGGWGPEFDGSMQPVGLQQADGTFIMAPYSAIHNNIKQFFNDGAVFQNGITLNAGSDSGYVLFSANQQNSEFVVKGDKLSRSSFNLKAGKKAGKLSIDGNINYTSQTVGNTDSGLFEDLLQTASNIPVGQFSAPYNQYHWTYYYASPYWTRENVRATSRNHYMSGIINLGYDINKHINLSYLGNLKLSENSNFSYNNGWIDNVQVDGPSTSQSITSSFYSGNSYAASYYGDLMLNFKYDLTKDLDLKFNIGNNLQDNRSQVTNVGGTNLDIAGLYNITNVLNPDNPSSLGSGKSRSRKAGLFANVDLGYKDYLFLNLTGRNDWVSTLPKDKNSYFYPSAGMSFIPTKAIKGLKGDILNYAKIAASYVVTGNSSSVSPYAIDPIGVLGTGFPFAGANSYVQNTGQTDANIKPEFITGKEVSLNLGFLKDRITLDASVYRTDSKDLITNVTASSASGLSTNRINIGAMNTKGVEIDLGFVPVKTKGGFVWNSRISYSSAKSVVTKVSDEASEVNLLSTTMAGIFAVEGEEFPTIKGTAYQRDDEGRVIIDATTGNPLRTSTFEKLGKATPDYTLGFNNSIEYKGFRLAAVMDYRTGHQFFSETKRELSWSGHLIESAQNGRTGFIYPNSSVETSPGVYTANTSVITGGTTYSSYLNYFSNEYSRVAENFVLDATAFKVRELSLSYTLPSKLVEKAGLTTVRFGINARNPFTVLPKQNRGYADPETSFSSGNAAGYANVGQYPSTRTYGFSLNVNF